MMGLIQTGPSKKLGHVIVTVHLGDRLPLSKEMGIDEAKYIKAPPMGVVEEVDLVEFIRLCLQWQTLARN